MEKMNKHKDEHLHLGGVLHNMEEGMVAAYDWLSGPAKSEKERAHEKFVETETLRSASGHII